jgi:Zn-dependent peptidase ImmA (M78 family)
VVFNPIHSVGRSNSDIAHELAHLLLEHELSEIQEIEGVPFRTCMPDQEEQATALGAAILLPERAVMRSARAGGSIDTVARDFEVTAAMARFRWNKLGVSRRLARSKQKA